MFKIYDIEKDVVNTFPYYIFSGSFEGMGTGIHQTTQKCPHPQKLIDVQQRPSNVHRTKTISCVTAKGIHAITVKAVTECLLEMSVC